MGSMILGTHWTRNTLASFTSTTWMFTVAGFNSPLTRNSVSSGFNEPSGLILASLNHFTCKAANLGSIQSVIG